MNWYVTGLQDKGLSERLQITLVLKFDKALEITWSCLQVKTRMEESQTKNFNEIQTNRVKTLKPKPDGKYIQKMVTWLKLVSGERENP